MQLEQRSLHREEKIQGKQKDTGNEWLATERKRKKKNRKAWIQCATPVLGKHTDTTTHMYTHKKHTGSHLLLPSGYKTSSKEA